MNDGFTCSGCKRVVLPAVRTTRNHCPYCFISRHVDGEIPGDRDTDCEGVMIPIQYLVKHGKPKIQFQCVTCGKLHINKTAIDDEMGDLLGYIQIYKKRYLEEVQ